MSEKFFQKGRYLLRLDNIRPIEAKPAKRIHLNCSMPVTVEDIDHAPTRIRKVWEIVSNPKLDCFRIPISSQLKGIDIDLFHHDGTDAAELIAIRNSILRDIHVDREKIDQTTWQVRLHFSLGIGWNDAVWHWGGEFIFLECYAKFSQSQGEMFDDNPADEQASQTASPEVERLRTVEVEDLAKDLGTNPPAPAQTPGTDPLLITPPGTKRRGRPRKVLTATSGKGTSTQPHA